jgi:CheY-like chemotaxis protein
MSQTHFLVVDDDPQVLEVAARACEEIGLTVLRAEDGAGALEILRENPEVELLLTDIAMPKMTGWELAHVAKQQYPDLKVIYTSGYIKTYPIGQHGMGYSNTYGRFSGGSAARSEITLLTLPTGKHVRCRTTPSGQELLCPLPNTYS